MEKKVKIGVNGWFFCRQYTGVGRYCLNIFSELARHFPHFEFYVAIPDKLDEEIDKNLRYQDNMKFEIIPEKPLLKALHAGLAKSYWEKNQLTAFFREKEVKLIHIPYPALYGKVRGAKVVITVHDTIPWTDREYFHRGFLSSFYNSATLKSARAADFILTVSEQSRGEILARSGFRDDRLAVVYNASEFNEAPDFAKKDKELLLHRFGLDSEDLYLFYMGGYDRRKNVQRVVDIFCSEIAPNSSLKLVLGGGKLLRNRLFSDLHWDVPKWKKSVIQTGFLNNRELIMLYREAWAYFSLTTREGFNLPLLEALTLECPALVSDLPVHREVNGDAPVFLNLQNTDRQIAEKVLNLYNSFDAYQKLKNRTAVFAAEAKKKYDWARSAQQIGNIYLKLLA